MDPFKILKRTAKFRGIQLKDIAREVGICHTSLKAKVTKKTEEIIKIYEQAGINIQFNINSKAEKLDFIIINNKIHHLQEPKFAVDFFKVGPLKKIEDFDIYLPEAMKTELLGKYYYIINF